MELLMVPALGRREKRYKALRAKQTGNDRNFMFVPQK